MRKLFKKPLVAISVVALLIVVGVVVLNRDDELEYDSVVAEKNKLVQEVDVTGRVEPADEVELSFKNNGRIAQTYVKIGDRVDKGQILVRLDNRELGAELANANAALENANANLQQYEAALESKKAELEDLRRGSTAEEIQLSETKVIRAEQTLTNAQIDLGNVKIIASTALNNLYDEVPDILNTAYNYADEAINKQVDDFFTASTTNPQLSFITSNTQAEVDAEAGYLNVGSLLIDFRGLVDNSSSGAIDPENALAQAEIYLSTVRDFLTRLTDTITVSNSLSTTVLSAYRTNLNSARTNINTAIASINGQEQDIATQKASNQNNIDTAEAVVSNARRSLTVAEDELSLVRAGATVEQIVAKEAVVKQAQASVASQKAQIKQAQAKKQSIQVKISNNILRSPLAGIVTKQDAKVGQTATANVAIVAIISEAGLEIKVDIPEADIAKVKIGDKATLTLDAYGDDVIFKAYVSMIDPAETMLEGLATYRTTLQFDSEDERVRPGMTANLDIVTKEKEKVIALPQSSVISKNGKKIVRVIKNGEMTEQEVVTGIRGVGGKIEIVSGLQEGDEVVIRTRKK